MKKSISRNGWAWIGKARVLLVAIAKLSWAFMFLLFQGVAFATGQHTGATEERAQSHAPTAAQLGLQYLTGKGKPKDEAKGIYWLERAAFLGDTGAARLLLRSYSNPKSKYFNLEKAAEIQKLLRPGEENQPGERSVKVSPDKSNDSPAQPPWPRQNLPRAEPSALGSGFAVNRAGSFVTNFHVVEGCFALVVDYQGMRGRAKLVAVAEEDDLAVLEVEGTTSSFVSIRASPPRLGEEVRFAGFPDGRLKISQGIVASIYGEELVQVSASLSSGNSGGPLIDGTGAVIGIAALKVPAGVAKGQVRGDDYNFAINTKRLRLLLTNAKIGFQTSNLANPLTPESAAALLGKVSAKILCYR